MNSGRSNRRNLGVQDGAFKAVDARVNVYARTREDTDKWIKQEGRDERFVDEITDIERQLGRTMERETFRKLVEGASPRLKVDYHPRLPTLAIHEIKWAQPWERDPITGKLGGQQKVYKMSVGSLEAPIIPEWSLLESKTVRNVSGEPIKIPARVVAHGWRRGLVMLVQAGYLTRTQAERIINEHGSGTRPSWQVLMGYKTPEGREFVY